MRSVSLQVIGTPPPQAMAVFIIARQRKKPARQAAGGLAVDASGWPVDAAPPNLKHGTTLGKLNLQPFRVGFGQPGSFLFGIVCHALRPRQRKFIWNLSNKRCCCMLNQPADFNIWATTPRPGSSKALRHFYNKKIPKNFPASGCISHANIPNNFSNVN
ncbi:hypothetical protein [Paraburkholderia sp. 2C]|jgi:hypothetical protein